MEILTSWPTLTFTPSSVPRRGQDPPPASEHLQQELEALGGSYSFFLCFIFVSCKNRLSICFRFTLYPLPFLAPPFTGESRQEAPHGPRTHP